MGLDPAALAQQRRARTGAPAVVLAGPRALLVADLVRQAGARLAGRLPGSPFGDDAGTAGSGGDRRAGTTGREGDAGTTGWSGDRGDAGTVGWSGGRRYPDLEQVALDPEVDGVVLDGEQPELAAGLPGLVAAGLRVLLPDPAPRDPGLLRAVLAVEEPRGEQVAVGLRSRAEPWVGVTARSLRESGAAPVQVTVRGWPSGPRGAAELVDVVLALLGDVVAVAAAPAPLPAEALPAGERVTWALLTGSGTTVLVSPEGTRTALRLSLPAGRLEAGPDGVHWLAGDRVPLPEAGAGEDADAPPDGADAGLWRAARAVVAGRGRDHAPGAAGLGDLLVVTQVLTSLRTSARVERWVEVGAAG